MNDDLSTLLDRMKLEHLDTQLDALCEDAVKHELDYRSFLVRALTTEWQGRQLRSIEARLKLAWPGAEKVDTKLRYRCSHETTGIYA